MKSFLPLFLIISLSISVEAQECIVPDPPILGNGLEWQTNTPIAQVGQTFTACQSGIITEISFEKMNFSILPHNPHPNATLFIENGIADGGQGLNPSADYSQSISIPNGTATVSLELTTPFPVTSGQKYTFYLQTDKAVAGGFSFNSTRSDAYPDGARWFNNTESSNGWDIQFSVTIIDRPASAIPTMSQWAIILFGTFILLLGSFAIVQVGKPKSKFD